MKSSVNIDLRVDGKQNADKPPPRMLTSCIRAQLVAQLLLLIPLTHWRGSR